jgi:hypothetical protein
VLRRCDPHHNLSAKPAAALPLQPSRLVAKSFEISALWQTGYPVGALSEKMLA